MKELVVFGLCLAWGTAHAISISGQGTWETTLQARDLDSDGVADAYYDTALNITWTANANINGLASWDDQLAWAGGFGPGSTNGWRLTRVNDTGAAGCDYGYSNTDCGYNVDPGTGELAHLFYVTLGNRGQFDTLGNPNDGIPPYPLVAGTMNTGPFSGLVYEALGNGEYFSGTSYQLTSVDAWAFGFVGGTQDYVDKTALHAAWAVHDGDVSAVPVPPAFWLFGTALGLLGWIRRSTASRGTARFIPSMDP